MWFFSSQVTLHVKFSTVRVNWQAFLLFFGQVFVCVKCQKLCQKYTLVCMALLSGRRQLGLDRSPTLPTVELSAAPVELQHESTSTIDPPFLALDYLGRIPASLHGLNSHSQHSLNVRGDGGLAWASSNLIAWINLCCVCTYIHPAWTFELVYILGQEGIHL